MKESDGRFFSSKQMMKIFNVNGCELMHLRKSQQLDFTKKGNAFLYKLPKSEKLLGLPVGQCLLNWHKAKHQSLINNKPLQQKSVEALYVLLSEVLIPVQLEFGQVIITYGFTSAALKKYISRQSSSGTAPSLDQHSGYEQNKKGNMICSRGGAACDFYVEQTSMKTITKYIVNNLSFDRLYFYGDNRPIHISANEHPIKHLQIMQESIAGRLFPGKRAQGEKAIRLVEEL